MSPPAKAEAALRRSDTLLQSFIGSLPSAVYRFVRDRRWKLDFVGAARVGRLLAGAAVPWRA
jgi:hypothetical protein